MESNGSKGDFFVTVTAAKLSIEKLATLKIHRQFSGYLAVVSAAATSNKFDNLKTNFLKFHNDYLLVSGAPSDRPYLQPFSESGKGTPQLFNKNVAGSYAPSSLRDVAPIRAVIEFKGSRQNVTQTLKPNHEEIALKVLADSHRVPVHSLATFLFRDHKIPASGGSGVDSMLRFFCATFGYDLEDPSSRARFETLYEPDESTFEGVVFTEA